MAIAQALVAASFLVTGLTFLLADSQSKIDRDPPRQTVRLYMTIGGQIIQSARGFRRQIWRSMVGALPADA